MQVHERVVSGSAGADGWQPMTCGTGGTTYRTSFSAMTISSARIRETSWAIFHPARPMKAATNIAANGSSSGYPTRRRAGAKRGARRQHVAARMLRVCTENLAVQPSRRALFVTTPRTG